MCANICLCKVDATHTMEFVAREAAQVMGGASYVLGKKVDRVYRDVRALAIYGDSEEIMLDVALRLPLKDGANVPFAAHVSKFYTKARLEFRARCVAWVEAEVLPKADA